MSKTAVIFPGIGYRCDKPLLYYASKLAAYHGYDITRITYPEYPINLKEATDEQLAEFHDILFISKSIGTAVATAYASRHLEKTGSSSSCPVRHILFTPLELTFK